MPLPKFGALTMPERQQETLSRTAAAARLELHVAHVDKMVRSGMLAVPITVASVDQLLGRSKLRCVSGELTVLRTDARQAANPDTAFGDQRRWIGYHVEHTDAELEETNLRWWRCTPGRVLDNELFAVTVATFPVAVYWVTVCLDSITRLDEEHPRHHFGGKLLARVSPGMVATVRQSTPGHLRPLVKTIMASRIAVNSGGPIGYLEVTPEG